MKAINLLVTLLFVLSLCFSLGLENGYAAKSTTKDAAASTAQLQKKSIGINSADKETLMQLPGVGPKTADAIVKYRKANGKFKSVEDLMNVKGIGEKTFAKMKPYLKL